MNYQIFQMINQIAGINVGLDALMIFFAQYSLIIFPSILLYLWFHSTNINKYEQSQKTAIYATISTILALLVNQVIHLIYFVPRPFAVHAVHQLIQHAANESSFVSDHSILAFSVAFTIFFRRNNIRYFVLILALLTGFSRIFVGVHYPVDILGSMIVSLFSSIIVIMLTNTIEPFVKFTFHLYAKIVYSVPFLARYISPPYDKS